MSVNVEPQGSKEITIPVSGLKSKPGTEYFIYFNVTTTEPEPLIPVGHEIAYEQFRLPVEPGERTFATGGPTLKVSAEGNELSASSSKVSFVFDKKTGLVSSYKVGGTEYFKDGFGLQLTSGVHRTITTMATVTPNACKYGNNRAKISM